MTRVLAISDTGLRLIKAFEGFRPVDRTLVTGIRVVGYGHKLDADADDVQMSRADAEERLLDDLEPIEEIVNDEVHAPLTQGQFDALCSLALNIGVEAFRASDIVRAMNNGRVLDAANGFDVWRKATVNGKTYVVDALMRRRTAEKSLFLRNEPAIPAPSAMLQPEPDGTAPLGSTDDGLPKVTVGSMSGVIEAANIINADRVEVSDAPLSGLSLSDLASRAEINDFETGSFDEDDLLDGILLSSDSDAPGDFQDDDHDDDEDFDDDYADDLDEDFLDDDDDDDGLDDDDFVDEVADDIADDDDVAGYDDDRLVLETKVDDASDDDALTRLMSQVDDDGVIEADIDQDSLTTISGDIDAVEADTEASTVISSAATSLGDRMSALLDTDDVAPKKDAINALPASLLQVTDTQSELVLDDDGNGPRSNLVSFPKRELILDDSIEADPVSTNKIDAETGLKVIDDLAADDVIRASRDPENPIFDPEGDPVENAMRYLERQASENQVKKPNYGMWIPVALGAALVGASAVFIGRGATLMLSSWGPTAVTAAAITGGLTLIFAIYAIARGRYA